MEPASALDGLPDLRRKSFDLLVSLSPEVFEDVSARASWLAAYQQSKRPRPGTPESIIVERTRRQIASVLAAAGGWGDAQVADMVEVLLSGSL